MRRAAWIFLASILLPSLGLAWMAIRSAQDQQVVLEHQQVIISQNITDALAKDIQSRMDQARADFEKSTRQLLNGSASPQMLAETFNHSLRDAWPLAEIGFAVNLDGEIYSPKMNDSPEARTFRDENDRFLSNRENVEVYSNSLLPSQAANFTQSIKTGATGGLPQKQEEVTSNYRFDLAKNNAASSLDYKKQAKDETAQLQMKQASAGKSQVSVASSTRTSALEKERTIPATEDAVPAAPSAPANEVLPGSSPATPAPMTTMTDAATPPPQAEMALKSAMKPAAAAKVPVFESDSPGAAAPASAAAMPAPDTTAAKSVVMSKVTAMPASPPAMNAPAGGASMDTLRIAEPQAATPAVTTPAKALPAETDSFANSAQNSSANIASGVLTLATRVQRQVIPQRMPRMPARDSAPVSNTVPEASDFRRVIGSDPSGALARFLENKLRLMVWLHPAESPIVFGAQLDQSRLVDSLKGALDIAEVQPDSYSRTSRTDYCVAILDDAGHPVAQSLPGFKADWKHPFVATEIGEVLPHWEATLYLVDPEQIGRAARTLQWTLGLIVLVLMAAIVAGGSLIAADVRRQMRLAQQKTDFVSNVSHELKTPLTSIRMFADLLAEKRVPDEARQSTYLRIISAEAARLTRLINNVLDFARLERGAPPGEHRECDLVDSVRDVVETCGPHLETAGVAFRHEIEAESLPISGDRDALAQIILNLVSNAEKYGGNDVLVRVRRQETAAGALGCVDVLDRGPGIPAAQVKTAFDPFHRLDDSLSSGIPGSGLGLTLARRMARAHGGDVTYSPRAGGGSCFTLTVPLTPNLRTA